MGCAERCELCGAPAAVHCAADAAFLCAACDAKVHGANFLASRHRRTRLHLDLDAGGYDSATSSSSSSCVSTADSAPMRGRRGPTTRRPHAEAVLEVWARRMGLPMTGPARRWHSAAAVAARSCRPDVPLRVAMAAALWREVVAAGGGLRRSDALRRLEACAHVPARLVVAVASSMSVARARARTRTRGRRRADVDAAAEGWDECSWAGPKSNNNPARS